MRWCGGVWTGPCVGVFELEGLLAHRQVTDNTGGSAAKHSPIPNFSKCRVLAYGP
jgi:hypothetical protein